MTTPRILLVEDNPSSAKMMRLALESEGYLVRVASDGRTALLELETPPDLVLLDLVLPDLDGLEVGRRLKSMPQGAAVPLIALSGFEGLLERSRTEFDAVLLKPIEPALLIGTVSRFLPSPALGRDPVGEGRRVLIADDDPVQLKLGRIRMGLLGFSTSLASSGAEALEVARREHPDVILADVLMPGMDGFELCLAIRRDPHLAQLPVVLTSAHYRDVQDDALAQRVGAQALVLRTPDFKSIADAVVAALDAPVSAPAKTEGLDREHAARVVQQLERQAAINEELSRRCTQQAAQLSILSGVATALARRSDPGAALGEVLASCLDAGGISKGALIRAGEDGAQVSHAVGFEDGLRVEQIPGLAPLLEIARKGETVTASRALETADRGAFLDALAVRSAVLIPVEAESGPHVLVLGSKLTDLGEADLMSFGRSIAANIGQALTLAASFNRAQIAAEASGVLFSSFDVQTILEGLARLLCERMADVVEIRIDSDDPALATSVLRRRDGRAMDSAQLERRGLSSQVLVPLTSRDGAIGSLFLGSTTPGHQFGTADQSFAEDLARRAGNAIENARLYAVAQAVNRAKDEFLATVSHELRTPLTAILGWATMFNQSRRLDPQVMERGLPAIERNAKSLAKLVEDILDVSRIISGKLTLNPQPIMLKELFAAAHDVLDATAKAKGLELVTRIDPAVEVVWADRDRLQQVLWNLLSNAIRFTPPGGRVELVAAPRETSIEIRVSDTGAGISGDFLPFVFDRFRQADGSSSRKHGGLGLGLSIVRHLVELHGGVVAAESAGPGLGATFRVVLPPPAVRLPADAAQARGSAQQAPPRGALEGLRVLVVEDRDDARELILSLLENFGVVVCGAASAEEGLGALDAFNPEVLISDLGMPVEDGYGFISRVRRISSIPAIALTAYGGQEAERAYRAGFQMFLSKPVEPDTLAAALAGLAGRL